YGRRMVGAGRVAGREVEGEQKRYFPRPGRCQQMRRWEPVLELGTVQAVLRIGPVLDPDRDWDNDKLELRTVQAVLRIGPALDPDKDLDEDKIKVCVATAPTLPIAPLVEDATAPLAEAAREEQRR